MVRLAINGFGRIGRCSLKIALERQDADVIAINDLGDPGTFAYLLKYDTAYGVYDHDVAFDDRHIIIDGKKILFLSEPEPSKLPWDRLKIDAVLECTGRFRDEARARQHIEAGARKVVISAPAKGKGIKTVVLGVNEEVVTADDEIISNASCTTNCIAPVMKILEDSFGIEKAMMTTVHSYTASQRLQDDRAKDLREGRAAGVNIIPTTTGASQATALTIPSLKDKFEGLSVRVPSLVVSLADITAVLKTDVSIADINAVFEKAASEPYYEGILDVTGDELVSSDFRGNSHSVVVDLPLTNVVDGNMVKIIAWYDNEWGYSNRLVELAADFGRSE